MDEPQSGVRPYGSEGTLVEARLKDISDEIVDLKHHLPDAPANGFAIELLEVERSTLLKRYIRTV